MKKIFNIKQVLFFSSIFVAILAVLLNSGIPRVVANATYIVVSEFRLSPEVVLTNTVTNPSFENWTSAMAGEPYSDDNGNSTWDEGESYCDLDSNLSYTSEYATANTPDNWRENYMTLSCDFVVTQEQTTVYDGSSAFKISTGTGDVILVSKSAGFISDILADETYTFSFYAKGSVGGEVFNAQASLVAAETTYYNFDNSVFETTVNDIDSPYLSQFTLTSDWARYSYTVTTNGVGAIYSNLIFGSDGTGDFSTLGDGRNQTIYVDAFQFEEASSASAFHTAGADSATFLELYNPTTTAIDLNGYKVQYRFDSGDWTNFASVSTPTSVGAGKFYLIKATAGDQVLDDEAVFDTDYVTNSETISGLALRVCSDSTNCATTITDSVGFGDAVSYEGTAKATTSWTTAKSYERKATSSSSAITMASGGAEEILGNAYDSDNNNNDFILLSTPVPQKLSSTAETAPSSSSSRSSQRAAQEYYDALMALEQNQHDTTDSDSLVEDTTLPTDIESSQEQESDNQENIDNSEPSSESEQNNNTPEEIIETPVFTPQNPTIKNFPAEQRGLKKFIEITGKLPVSNDWQTVHFLAYGQEGLPARINENERIGLVNDFTALYGHLPKSESDWLKISDMANNEKIEDKLIDKEKIALVEFIRVYKRLVNFSNPAEEKFIHMVAYRLRVADRDLARENNALSIFAKAYGQMPNSSHLWSVFRAIAYAGVK